MTDDQVFDGCQQIEYRDLMSRLADLVGRHQLPVRADAADINDILDGDPVHYELVRELVRSIYRSSRCGHLDDEVRAETVFNTLGGIRGRLLAEGDTDIDQVNLLEELGWAARTLFAAAPHAGPETAPDEDADDDGPVVVQHPAV